MLKHCIPCTITWYVSYITKIKLPNKKHTPFKWTECLHVCLFKKKFNGKKKILGCVLNEAPIVYILN